MRYTANFILGFLIVASSFLSSEEGIKWYDSPIYRRYIQQISYQSIGHDTVATIECSDNTKWKFIATPADEIALYELQENLKIGSEMFLETIEGTPSYWLGNEIKFRVNICKESLSFLPTIVKLEEITVSEGGWFSFDENIYLLTLSDGSLWELNYSYSWTHRHLSFWELGHHIFVGRETVIKRQQLIDIEAPYSYNDGYKGDLREVSEFEFDIKLLIPPSEYIENNY